MPYTRDDKELIGLIKTALRDVHDPCTVEELCQNCKELRRRQEKVKQGLENLYQQEIVEHHGEEYMLAENVTESILDQWLTRVHDREENLSKRKLSYSSYADAAVGAKRRESAPGQLAGACGFTTPQQRQYKKSYSDIGPGPSTSITPQVPAVQQGGPVVQNITNHVEHHHHHHHQHDHNQFNMFVSPQYNNCDLSSNDRTVINPGDNASFQIGNQNQMTLQETPKRKPKGKRK